MKLIKFPGAKREVIERIILDLQHLIKGKKSTKPISQVRLYKKEEETYIGISSLLPLFYDEKGELIEDEKGGLEERIHFWIRAVLKLNLSEAYKSIYISTKYRGERKGNVANILPLLFLPVFVEEATKILNYELKRGYVREYDSLPTLKGRIDFKYEHVLYLEGKISQTYFQRTWNIPINGLILHTAKGLLSTMKEWKDRSYPYEHDLHTIITRLEELGVEEHECFKDVHPPYEYNKLFKIIKAILQERSFARAVGRMHPSMAIDENRLFELFITKILESEGFESQRGEHFGEVDLKPDLIDRKRHIILDIKNKEPGEDASLQAQHCDLYQIYSYKKAFEHLDKAKYNVGLIYRGKPANHMLKIWDEACISLFYVDIDYEKSVEENVENIRKELGGIIPSVEKVTAKA